MFGAEMEKKSNCPHVKYLGFAGLPELLAKRVVKGSYTGPKSLIEDVSLLYSLLSESSTI
jgi:hypothetical protein